MRVTAIPLYLNKPTMSPFSMTELDLERAKAWCHEKNISISYYDYGYNYSTLILPIDCTCCIESMLFANITNEDWLKIHFDYNDDGE